MLSLVFSPHPKMLQWHVEVPSFPTPDLERPRTPVNTLPHVAHTTEPTITPLAGTMTPEDSPQPPKKTWVRHSIFRRQNLVLLACFLLIIMSLVTAKASNSHAHYAFEGPTHNESGVGFLAQHADRVVQLNDTP